MSSAFFDNLVLLSQVEDAPKLSRNNRNKIVASTQCGCYFCLTTVYGSEITEWVDDGTTPLCPRCDIDSVIPNITDTEFLVAAHERWFSGTE